MIYNPYNTTVQNPGLVQPGMLQQTSYPVAQQPAMLQQTGYPVAQQPAMLQQTGYPVAQQSAMLQQTGYPVAQQSVMPMATYPTSTTTHVANPTAYQPVQQSLPAVPAVPVPPCSVHTCGVPAPVCGVPVAQPMVVPQPVQQIQTVQQSVEPQVTSTQSTTAQHKKTTYVEAYLEPVDAQVPLMQPTVSKKVVEKKTYPVSDDIVYVEQKPLKNSTMQDYNLYLMENEYYSDDQPTYKKTVSPRTRADQRPLNCENLPLATTYIQAQTYTGLNNPTQTLQQGTLFNELYSPYTPQKVSTPTVFMLKGGQQ